MNYLINPVNKLLKISVTDKVKKKFKTNIYFKNIFIIKYNANAPGSTSLLQFFSNSSMLPLLLSFSFSTEIETKHNNLLITEI